MEKKAKVCVTGGSGYIGSFLVKKLLEKGYTVHSTLRNLEDNTKVGMLKSLPNADTNLVLFQADIYNNVNEFEAAIEGCDFVFHVATPLQNGPPNSHYKNRIEATVGAAKGIAEACIKSKTVKRLIYTGSVMAASPLNEDGKSFKTCMDESCWTPLHLSFSFANDFVTDYVIGKTVAEKEVLRYNEVENARLEVVTLVLGLVGGDNTILSYVPSTVGVINSQITRDLDGYNHGLLLLQQFFGSIPIVNVDDVCEAHNFCIERPKIKGRFLCAVANTNTLEIATYFTQHYPEFNIANEFMGVAGEKIILDTSKLVKMGFEYKCDMKKILDDNVKCERRLRGISQNAIVN